MGYGKNLQEAIKNKNMSVRHVAHMAGVSVDTLYSIIRRDTSVRFDHALRLANILDIDINLICKDNPYQEGDVLPELLSQFGGLTTNLNKTSYIKNRMMPLLMLFDYDDLAKVDQLLSNFYSFDDKGRETVFNMISGVNGSFSDKERKKKLKEIR